MNQLDKAIAWLSPAAGLRRARARLAMDQTSLYFEGARRDRRGASWSTRNPSANAASQGKLKDLRARASDLCRNNPHAKRARNELALRLVGTGLVPRFDSGSDAKNRVLRDDWAEWSRSASADGLPSIEAMQVLMCKSWFERGEVFVRRRDRYRDDGMRIPLQAQIMEADFCDFDKNQDLGLNGQIQQGIEFTPFGRRRSYWMFRVHPGDSVAYGQDLQSKPVDAAEILHLYEWDRPGQLHGVPGLAVVTAMSLDLSEYEEAELVRKKLEACHVGFVEQTDLASPKATSDVTLDATGTRVQRFEPGMFIYGQPGETIEFNNPQGNGAYDAYKKARLRDFCAGVQMPYPVIAEDPGAANYSSSRMGAVGFRDYVNQLRWVWFVPLVCQPMADWFLDAEKRIGTLAERDRVQVQWSEPAFSLLDRNEEAKGTTAMLRNLTLTPQQAIAEQGWDPAEQVAEIAAFYQQIDGLNIASDGDARKAKDQGENPQGGGAGNARN